MPSLENILNGIDETTYDETVLPDVSSYVKQSINLGEDTEDEDTSEDEEWIIKDVIPNGSITYVVGEGQTGKTHLIGKFLASITSGIPFYGHESVRGKVLYVGLEDKKGSIKKILRDSNVVMGQVEWLNDVTEDKARLTTQLDTTFSLPEHMKELLLEVQKINPVVIVIDTIARCTGEKGANVQETVAKQLRSLAVNTGIAIILVGHLQPGHYNLNNMYSRYGKYVAFYNVSRASYLTINDDSKGIKGVINTKNNNSHTLPPMGFKIYKNIGGHVVMDRVDVSFNRENEKNNAQKKDSAVKQAIMAYLQRYGESTPIEISSAIGVKHDIVKTYVRRLLKESKVQNVSYGVYAIYDNKNGKNDILSETTGKTSTSSQETTENTQEDTKQNAESYIQTSVLSGVNEKKDITSNNGHSHDNALDDTIEVIP